MLMGIDDGAGAAGGATGPTAADISAAATKAANEAVNARAEADRRANATAAAEAERVATEAATKARADAAEGKLAAAHAKLRDGAILGQLAGLKDPAKFLPIFTADLGDVADGVLSPDQIAKLATAKAAHPYLFTEAQTPLGSTPGSSAGHRPADGAFDSEDSRIMTQLGVAGRKVRETAEYKRYGWLSDKNWKPQP